MTQSLSSPVVISQDQLSVSPVRVRVCACPRAILGDTKPPLVVPDHLTSSRTAKQPSGEASAVVHQAEWQPDMLRDDRMRAEAAALDPSSVCHIFVVILFVLTGS